MSVYRITPLVLMGALAWACNDQSSQGDGGAGGDGSGLLADSAGAGTIFGGGTVVPRGNAPKGPFQRGWSYQVGRDSGHKSVPQVGRFNKDVHNDIVANPRLVAFQYYENQGNGSFAAPTKMLSTGFAGGWGCDVGDINKDRKLDVAFGDHVAGARVFLGDGQGGFSESSPTLTGNDNGTFSGAGLGDLNGDGNLDLLLGADQFGVGMHLLYGDGTGKWTKATGSGLPPFSKKGMGGGGFSNVGYYAFADVDNDHDLDLFAFGQNSGLVPTQGLVACRVFRNDGQGKSFTQIAELTGGTSGGVGSPVQGSVADIDGNGYMDVVSGGTVYLNQDGKTFTQGAVVDTSFISHLADMDGDGKLDLVTHHRKQGLRLYLGDGTGKTWKQDTTAGLPDANTFPPNSVQNPRSINAYGIDVSDLDNNGTLDVVRVVTLTGGMMGTSNAGFLSVWLR